MKHTFLIDNYVLVLERKKIKFKKKRKKFLTNPIISLVLSVSNSHCVAVVTARIYDCVRKTALFEIPKLSLGALPFDDTIPFSFHKNDPINNDIPDLPK